MMKEWEREELLIRMDERIKTIYNSMDKFDLDTIDQIYNTTFNFMKEKIKCLH